MFPDTLYSYILRTYGSPQRIEPLRGQSHARLWRLLLHNRSLLIKASAQAREAWFYENAAPVLRHQGVPVADCEWIGSLEGFYWLILEDVPTPLPHTRWLADPEQLAVLRLLHRCQLLETFTFQNTFQPEWTDSMTQTALTFFKPDLADSLLHILDPLQRLCQPLFMPQHCIMGDPNPTNWGIRSDGSLVSYDWERFALGTSPLDLAITVPGLGDSDAFTTVAATYLCSRDSASIERFVQEIAIAKVWSVVEYLSACSEGGVRVEAATIDYLRREVPQWLYRIFYSVERSDTVAFLHEEGI